MKSVSLIAIMLCYLFLCLFPISQSVEASLAKNQNPQYVYLTFDDGPLAGSEHINSIVLEEKIPISVFVVGTVMSHNKQLRGYFDLYQNNPYIDVYNHSYSHAGEHYDSYYREPQTVVDDILKNERKFHLPYKIVRLPGGNVWRIGKKKRDFVKICIPAANRLAAKGYTIVGWDLEWFHDASTAQPIQSVEELVDQIAHLFQTQKTFTPGHVVLLLHDEMFQEDWEASELKQMIEALKNKGYILRHLREYPGVPKQ